MIDAITRLRTIADEVEALAAVPGADAATRAEMIDIAARWHLLAREAAFLCNRSAQLTGRAPDCDSCRERCANYAH